MEAYLKVEGMNDTVVEKLLEKAVLIKSTAELFDEIEPVLLVYRAQNPELFQIMSIPPLWEKTKTLLSTHIDCIMHMLFLGMVKTVITDHVPKWLKSLNKHTSFVENNGYYLDTLQSMSIDWLMILCFGKGTMGSWVSENFLGFSRILLWFYQNIEAAPERIEDIPPSGVAQKAWSIKHNKY